MKIISKFIPPLTAITAHVYAEKNWWITTGILFQFEGNGDPAPVSADNKNWDEHEKYHIGLAYGYEF